MTKSKVETDAPPAGVGVSLERAAEILHVDKARVETLGYQGRLQVFVEPGEERRYGYESVLHMRAEDLMRDLTAKARAKCPELEEQVEALAVIQFCRGQMSGQRFLAVAMEKAVERMGRKAEA